MENKRVFLLVECTDYDEIYKILIFNEDVCREDVQSEIDTIKANFHDNEFYSLDVDDILERLRNFYQFDVFDYYDCLEV